MGQRQGRLSTSKNAKRRGEAKKRRRKRAERREATKEVREVRNKQMRAQEHPGWVENPPKWLKELS